MTCFRFNKKLIFHLPVIFCILFCFSLSSAPAQYGNQPGRPGPLPANTKTAPVKRNVTPQYKPTGNTVQIVDVRVVGNESISKAKALTYIDTKPNRVFDSETVQRDVHRLRTSGFFHDVRPGIQEVPGGVVVIFQVVEKPVIREIVFVGNTLLDKYLLKQSGLKVGDAIDPYSVEDAENNIEEFYQKKGYSKIKVSILEGSQPGDRRVVFLVNEGKKQRIWDVKFIGNEYISSGRLKTQIQSKPGFFKYLFRGTVDRKKIDEDVIRLTSYYRSLGFFSARVGREYQWNSDQKWLTINYVIDEGPRAVVRRISFVGNEKFSELDLKQKMKIAPGDFFNLNKMNSDKRALRDLYGSQGHIFAVIKESPRFLEEPGRLDLIYEIQEGNQFRVGEILVNITGDNPHTKKSVILNRLSLQPGDIIDNRIIEASEIRLMRSQLFRNEVQRGGPPRITVKPPTLEDTPASIAGRRPRQQGSQGFRGQSPDPMPMIRSTRQADLRRGSR